MNDVVSRYNLSVERLDWDLERESLQPRVRAILARHGLLAFPTGSSYGLGIDPTDAEAARLLLAVKGERGHKPLPLILADVAHVERVAQRLPPAFACLSDAFWPGALSLVLEARPELVEAVTAGTASVAVRVPAHPVARAVARAAGGVLTATSANCAGEPPLLEASAVARLLAAAPALLVDAGPAGGAARSTLLDLRTEPARLLRRGRIGLDALVRVLGSDVVAPPVRADAVPPKHGA